MVLYLRSSFFVLRSSFFVLRSSFFVLRSSFFVLSLALSLSSCKELGKVKFDSIQEGTATVENSSIIFAGISSIDQVTDTTMRLNWTAHADAVSYNVYNVTSGSVVFLATVSGQSSSSYTATGLTSGTLYKFRVRAVDSLSKIDVNIIQVSATTTSSTPAPTSLTLITPGSASDVSDIPTVRISGVKSGDNVKLFTNNTCTTQVASGTASSTTIDLTTSSLSVGANNFYATTGTSICSTATLAYTRVACSAGYTLSSGVCVLNFAGVTSVTNKTDSTLTINWTNNASASAYQIYRMVSGTPSYLTTVTAPASTVSLTGFTPNTAYTFRVRALDSTGTSDINTATQTVTTNLAPDVPSGIALQTPSYTPALISTPTIRVSGVKNGDVIKLFTDSSCTAQVASGTAAGTTIDLTTSTLTPAAYTFYANSTNTLTNASACSSATVAYVRNACPTNFIAVPFNTGVGTTTDFCVAKYEMKCVGTSCPTATPGANAVATSQSSGAPWVSITQTNSITACSNLNAINGVSNKYYLISNPEWMTVARNIENVDSNWTNGTAGSGILARGWTNGSNTAVASSTDASCLYNTGANTCGATGTIDYRRTLNLSNSEVIWDLSGNVWEWVNWQVTPANKAYIAATPIGTDQGWKEFKDLNTNVGGSDEMKPSTWQSTFLTATGTEGIGRYYAGTNSSGGAALRGGFWVNGTYAGAFTLDLYYSSVASDSNIGFRCVYRP